MSLLICDTSLIAVEAGSNAGVVFPRPTLLLLCALSRGAMKDWIGSLVSWLCGIPSCFFHPRLCPIYKANPAQRHIWGGSVLSYGPQHLMKYFAKDLIDRRSYVAQYVSLAPRTVGTTTLLCEDDNPRCIFTWVSMLSALASRDGERGNNCPLSKSNFVQ